MVKDIVLGEDIEITLCILYVVGAVVSIWMIVLSPFLTEWMGAKLIERPKNQRNWPKIFLVLVLLQPFTFLGSAVGLWWYGVVAILPPVHFMLSCMALLAIDFFRDADPWEKEYSKLVNKW